MSGGTLVTCEPPGTGESGRGTSEGDTGVNGTCCFWAFFFPMLAWAVKGEGDDLNSRAAGHNGRRLDDVCFHCIP